MIKGLIKIEIKLIAIILACQIMGIFAVDLVKPSHGENLVWCIGFVSGVTFLHPFIKGLYYDLSKFVDELINRFMGK